MRHKDENKSEAIFKATISLLNEIGFSDISMSKIAKRANVSSATIYVYFENKEDLLAKLYLNVKEKMGRIVTQGITGTLLPQEACERFMRNSMQFILENKDEFLFLDQFSTSPLLAKLHLGNFDTIFAPLYACIEDGKKAGVLKPFETTLLLSYCYIPVTALGKAHFSGQYEASEENLQYIIRMSWDAIRL